MEETTKLSLVELLSGVPAFDKVLEVMKSKQFVSPDSEVAPDAILIGVMSPLERACYTLLNVPISKLPLLGKCPNGTVEGRCLSVFTFEMNECPFANELAEISKEFDVVKPLRDLMFALIQSRLGAMNLDSIHLNVGFKLSTSTAITPSETIEVFQGAEELPLEEMLEISLKGTFMESVLATMQSGVFVGDDPAIKEGEQVIRPMTDFEKALWTEISKSFQTGKLKSDELDTLLGTSDAFVHMGMVISVGTDIDTGGIFGVTDENHPDVAKAHQLREELSQLKSSAKSLKSFFWAVVKSNTTQEYLDLYDTTGVRQGFQITMFNED
ncbi:MAG: hypothetical protein WCP92_04700 [bacterium]